MIQPAVYYKLKKKKKAISNQIHCRIFGRLFPSCDYVWNLVYQIPSFTQRNEVKRTQEFTSDWFYSLIVFHCIQAEFMRKQNLSFIMKH